MKSVKQTKDSTPSSSAKAPADQSHAVKPTQDKAKTANELGQGVDRPGFDMGGPSHDTHAGTGLGLGTDAFENPGDRRLPGRRLDNKVTIPRWGGAGKHNDAHPPKAETEPKKPR